MHGCEPYRWCQRWCQFVALLSWFQNKKHHKHGVALSGLVPICIMYSLIKLCSFSSKRKENKERTASSVPDGYTCYVWEAHMYQHDLKSDNFIFHLFRLAYIQTMMLLSNSQSLWISFGLQNVYIRFCCTFFYAL